MPLLSMRPVLISVKGLLGVDSKVTNVMAALGLVDSIIVVELLPTMYPPIAAAVAMASVAIVVAIKRLMVFPLRVIYL